MQERREELCKVTVVCERERSTQSEVDEREADPVVEELRDGQLREESVRYEGILSTRERNRLRSEVEIPTRERSKSKSVIELSDDKTRSRSRSRSIPSRLSRSSQDDLPTRNSASPYADIIATPGTGIEDEEGLALPLKSFTPARVPVHENAKRAKIRLDSGVADLSHSDSDQDEFAQLFALPPKGHKNKDSCISGMSLSENEERALAGQVGSDGENARSAKMHKRKYSLAELRRLSQI